MALPAEIAGRNNEVRMKTKIEFVICKPRSERVWQPEVKTESQLPAMTQSVQSE